MSIMAAILIGVFVACVTERIAYFNTSVKELQQEIQALKEIISSLEENKK